MPDVQLPLSSAHHVDLDASTVAASWHDDQTLVNCGREIECDPVLFVEEPVDVGIVEWFDADDVRPWREAGN
jgi:hypothetical protein